MFDLRGQGRLMEPESLRLNNALVDLACATNGRT